MLLCLELGRLAYFTYLIGLATSSMIHAPLSSTARSESSRLLVASSTLLYVSWRRRRRRRQAQTAMATTTTATTTATVAATASGSGGPLRGRRRNPVVKQRRVYLRDL